MNAITEVHVGAQTFGVGRGTAVYFVQHTLDTELLHQVSKCRDTLKAIETYAALRKIAETAEVWNLRDREAGKKRGSDHGGPHLEDVRVIVGK